MCQRHTINNGLTLLPQTKHLMGSLTINEWCVEVEARPTVVRTLTCWSLVWGMNTVSKHSRSNTPYIPCHHHVPEAHNSGRWNMLPQVKSQGQGQTYHWRIVCWGRSKTNHCHPYMLDNCWSNPFFSCNTHVAMQNLPCHHHVPEALSHQSAF